MASILIAYATRHGSTREVAEAISARLSERGAAIEMQLVAKVRSVEGFDAVVLGAPIYSGRWDPHAVKFLKRHRRKLESLPVAIFALGPRDTTDEAFTRSRGQLDRSLGHVAWLKPASVELFGGVDPPKRNRPDRRDARDWVAIYAWADALPEALQQGLLEDEE
jgi:menaquinone-dependent protoporphyrinogen oxidase